MIINAFNNCSNSVRSIALGNFDGVHIAHQRVIASAIEFSRALGSISCVVTFSHPPALTLGHDFSLISQKESKEKYIADLGIDELIYIDFDKDFMELSPYNFFDILKNRLGAASVSCGFNYRFGNNKSGDSRLLKNLCNKSGVDFNCLSPINFKGAPISSTRIRKLIENGDIAEANLLLGHPFEINNPVISGKHLGSKLNFPTANQALPDNFVTPRFGVYLTKTVINGKTYNSVTNIGKQPTVDGTKILCETNILDFLGNIYGENIKVEYYKFLRDERKFTSIEELKKNIDADISVAKRYFNKFE